MGGYGKSSYGKNPKPDKIDRPDWLNIGPKKKRQVSKKNPSKNK